MSDIGGWSNYKPSGTSVQFQSGNKNENTAWTFDDSLPLTLSVYVESNGNVTYGVANGNNSQSWSYSDNSYSYESGYFYVSNRAGSSDQYARDLYVGAAPPSESTDYEV
jgi:hypothetical protein